MAHKKRALLRTSPEDDKSVLLAVAMNNMELYGSKDYRSVKRGELLRVGKKTTL